MSTYHIQVLPVEATHDEQSVAAETSQQLPRAHFSTKKLIKVVVWHEYFVTEYNLKDKGIIRTWQQPSCRNPY